MVSAWIAEWRSNNNNIPRHWRNILKTIKQTYFYWTAFGRVCLVFLSLNKFFSFRPALDHVNSTVLLPWTLMFVQYALICFLWASFLLPVHFRNVFRFCFSWNRWRAPWFLLKFDWRVASYAITGWWRKKNYLLLLKITCYYKN